MEAVGCRWGLFGVTRCRGCRRAAVLPRIDTDLLIICEDSAIIIIPISQDQALYVRWRFAG